MTKERKLALIWRHTHRDYRSKLGPDKAILINRGAQGTCLVSLDALTDSEIESKLPYALKCEERP